MPEIGCIKTAHGAHRINVAAVSQEALDKADAALPQDQPCILLTFTLPGHKPGEAKLSIDQAEELASVLLSEVVDSRRSAKVVRRGYKPPPPTEQGPPPLTVGRRVRELRAARGMTRDELATLSGCRVSSVWRTEADLSIPQDANLRKLEKALGVEGHELMTLAAEVRARNSATARRSAQCA